MPFTDAQKTTFEDWIKSHNAYGSCPACGHNEGWTIADSLIAGMELTPKEGGKYDVHPSKLAMIATVCNNCQHIRLFAAAPILGI